MIKNILKYTTILLFTTIYSTNFVLAQGLLGFKEASGCETKDKFLPSLVICGRSPTSGACAAYQKPCGLGDLIETGRRVLIFIISGALLLLPIYISYLGVMIIYARKLGGGIDIAKWKERLMYAIIYMILLLCAWLIVKVVIDIFQVNDRIDTFMLDRNGNKVKAMPVNLNR